MRLVNFCSKFPVRVSQMHRCSEHPIARHLRSHTRKGTVATVTSIIGIMLQSLCIAVCVAGVHMCMPEWVEETKGLSIHKAVRLRVPQAQVVKCHSKYAE